MIANIDKELLDKIRELDEFALYELDEFIHQLIGIRVTYYQRSVNCGKDNCKKCQEGKGHGKYWYAKFRYGGKQYMAYVGKEKKPIDPLAVVREKEKSNKGGK